nr:hypothetical protein [Tanacetum cinerariifolium]
MSQKYLCNNSGTLSRRVEGEDIKDVPDDETALAFILNHGYKGPLNKHTNMFVDHMHQPWRTLAAIINKCLFGKTASNDKLQKIISDVHQIFNSSDPTQEKQRKRSQETVDVSEESEPESKPAMKKTASRRVVKKKVTLSVDDNIIFDDPDAALELAKSISQTEAEAARKVHATHARIVTEFAKKKSSGRMDLHRSSKSVIIQDTPSALKSKTKLKGAPSLTLQEQEAADIMQALKESKKTIRRQPDEQDSEFSDDDNDDEEKDDKDGDIDDEGDDHVNDTQHDNDEDDETKSDEDEIYYALYQSIYANKSFNRNPANHRLYHALMEALIEDEIAMDKGVADTVKNHKRKHDDDEDDDDEDPPARPNQGKKTKRRRTKEFESLKKPSSTKETPKGKASTKG